MTAARFLSAALDAVLTLALAPVCAACARPLEHPSSGAVCPNCWSSITPLLPPLCLRCGDTLPGWRTIGPVRDECARCRRTAVAFDAGCTAGDYDGALKSILHAFKYDGRRSLARELGRLMCTAGASLVTGAACAVPVPLHTWRRLQRGFNQAADLAAATRLPVIHALCRTRHTPSQTGLTAGARHRNVRDAFALSPRLSRRALRGLRGQAVVLVDDVRTTGATLNACARVLKNAGVREVRVLTAARAAPAAAAGRHSQEPASP